MPLSQISPVITKVQLMNTADSAWARGRGRMLEMERLAAGNNCIGSGTDPAI